MTFLVGLGSAATVLIAQVHEHYPVQKWLFWRYLEAWSWTLVFGLAALSLGGLIGRWLIPHLPLRERLIHETALGVVAFFLLFFAGGVLDLLGPWFSVSLAFGSIALGARPLWRRGRRAFHHLRALRDRPRPPRPWWHGVAVVYGVVSLAFIYYTILSPQNAAFDARFYHLAIAEKYAVEGGIHPTPEAWWPAALPHLASVLYTWCFTLPRLDVFSKIVASAHVEALLFLVTLGSIGVLVRRLVPGSKAPVAWVALFLFPSIYLYDSALTIAADHVTALFAIPIYLVMLRCLRRGGWRLGAVLGILGAGAILTKYQAIYLLAPPAVALTAMALYKTLRRLLRRPGRGASASAIWSTIGAGAVAGLVTTIPHWLKNWVFYGNPVFPNLMRIFPPTGYPEGTQHVYEVWKRWQTRGWSPHSGSAWGNIQEGAKTLFTFSFVNHDWSPFHGAYPVFGFLFTLFLFLLPFLRHTRRVWALVIATHLGLWVWFFSLHQDRYLQILVPWMAASVAATVVLVWREPLPLKIGVSGLLALQVIWGGDVHSIAAHMMTRQAPAITTTELLAAGQQKRYEARLKIGGQLFELGVLPALPADAQILLHEEQQRMGTFHRVVSDIAGWQLRLRYEQEPSARSLHATLTGMGLTHIFAIPHSSRQFDSLGADLRFLDFVLHDTRFVDAIGGFALLEILEPPAEVESTTVAYLGCSGIYEPGLHELRDLNVRNGQSERMKRRPRPAKEPLGEDVDVEAMLERAQFIVVGDEACPGDSAWRGGFVQIGKRGAETLWARARPLRGGGITFGRRKRPPPPAAHKID
ncbi:MAG: glycosyltransferase family 39 protein [Myxococcales bacterium]|nr:glycosyltransferase family 39 protein [Myxococcales bacterium]